MKMYLPFGDWSDDGHGRSDELLIDAPSMEHLLNAQKALKEQYGDWFFHDFAEEYEESTLCPANWQALKDSNYPIERLIEFDETNDWTGVKSIDEVLSIGKNPFLSIEFIMDAFIWLLNWKGAEITVLNSDEHIPTICNWTCPGFETVGYGCYC
jgi:hypothetical protein